VPINGTMDNEIVNNSKIDYKFVFCIFVPAPLSAKINKKLLIGIDKNNYNNFCILHG
jgi:hypothetical protein